jgi:hypothetical protein
MQFYKLTVTTKRKGPGKAQTTEQLHLSAEALPIVLPALYNVFLNAPDALDVLSMEVEKLNGHFVSPNSASARVKKTEAQKRKKKREYQRNWQRKRKAKLRQQAKEGQEKKK